MYSFIVLEGIDNSGKTTLSKILQKEFNAELISFPDRNTETGKELTEFLKNKKEINPRKLHSLFTKNRNEKNDFIKSCLKRKNVISDRYWMSCASYSLAHGLGYEECMKREIKEPTPDFVFFLDVKPEECFKRLKSDLEVYDTIEFQKKVYKSYKENFSNKMIFIKSDTIENMSKEIINYIK